MGVKFTCKNITGIKKKTNKKKGTNFMDQNLVDQNVMDLSFRSQT